MRRSSAASAARPCSAAPGIRRRSASALARSTPTRGSGRSGASTSPTPRTGRRSPTTACRVIPRAGRSARSRAPSSCGLSGGRSRRRLRSGETAAPERESLALLPSGPDAVRMLPVRGTRPSTPRARSLIPLKPPSDGVRSRWSGCRVQGTANSPPSATGQKEPSSAAILSSPGRIAQRESARFTRERSLVQSQVRPLTHSTTSRLPCVDPAPPR